MKKFLTILLSLVSFYGYSQGSIAVEASEVEAPNGVLVEVDITLADDGFNNITGCSGTITWDTAVIAYSNITYFGIVGNPDLEIGDFDVSDADEGELTWEWSSFFTVGPSLGNGAVLFTIQFLVVGESGEVSPVAFEDVPVTWSWNNGFGWSGPWETTDGSVTVGGLNLAGCYDPQYWTANTENTSGDAYHDGTSIILEGDNDLTGNGTTGLDCAGTEGTVSYCVDIPHDGEVSFDWEYNTTLVDISNADSEAFGYCLNGEGTQLATTSPPPFGTPLGTATFEVSGGDELCLTLSSENADFPNGAEVTISNFTGPPCELQGLTASIVEVQNVACTGDATGELQVVAEFGVEPYTYSWVNDGPSGDNPSGLTAGEYCVWVIDAENDSAFACHELTEAEELLTASAISNPDDGFGTGMALVNVDGGVSPYEITWNTDPVQTGAIASGLDAGVYEYTIVDQLGCTIIGEIEVIFVGIEEIIGLESFNVYPNPSSGIINLEIEFSEEKNYSIRLINSVGQQIQDAIRGRNHSVREVLDLQDLPKGLYFLNMEIDGQIYNHKVSIR